MKYCQYCGKQIKDGIKFCPYCGKQQPVMQQPIPDQNAQMSMQNNQQINSNPQSGVFDQQINSNLQNNQQAAAGSNQQDQQYNNGQQPYQQQNNQQQYQQQYQQPAQPSPSLSQQFQQFQQRYTGDINNQMQLGFIGSNKYAVAHWNDLKTPESRKSIFWWSLLGLMLAYIAVVTVIFLVVAVLEIIIVPLGTILDTLAIIAFSLAYVGVSIVWITAMVRRLRYLDKNPWLVVTLFIPIVQLYAIYLMIMDKPVPMQWNPQGYPNQGAQQPNQTMYSNNSYQNQPNYQNMQQPTPNSQPNMQAQSQATSQAPISSISAQDSIADSEANKDKNND